jgi:hypothetical protein
MTQKIQKTPESSSELCNPAKTGAPSPDNSFDGERRSAYEASLACLDVRRDDIRLAAGEMTEQEMLTVEAVLGWMRFRIQEAARKDGIELRQKARSPER